MSYVSKATEFLHQFIKENPQLEEEATDLYNLFLDEVSEEGTSPFNEYTLFVQACRDLK